MKPNQTELLKKPKPFKPLSHGFTVRFGCRLLLLIDPINALISCMLVTIYFFHGHNKSLRGVISYTIVSSLQISLFSFFSSRLRHNSLLGHTSHFGLLNITDDNTSFFLYVKCGNRNCALFSDHPQKRAHQATYIWNRVQNIYGNHFSSTMDFTHLSFW